MENFGGEGGIGEEFGDLREVGRGRYDCGMHADELAIQFLATVALSRCPYSCFFISHVFVATSLFFVPLHPAVRSPNMTSP